MDIVLDVFGVGIPVEGTSVVVAVGHVLEFAILFRLVVSFYFNSQFFTRLAGMLAEEVVDFFLAELMSKALLTSFIQL